MFFGSPRIRSFLTPAPSPTPPIITGTDPRVVNAADIQGYPPPLPDYSAPFPSPAPVFVEPSLSYQLPATQPILAPTAPDYRIHPQAMIVTNYPRYGTVEPILGAPLPAVQTAQPAPPMSAQTTYIPASKSLIQWRTFGSAAPSAPAPPVYATSYSPHGAGPSIGYTPAPVSFYDQLLPVWQPALSPEQRTTPPPGYMDYPAPIPQKTEGDWHALQLYWKQNKTLQTQPIVTAPPPATFTNNATPHYDATPTYNNSGTYNQIFQNITDTIAQAIPPQYQSYLPQRRYYGQNSPFSFLETLTPNQKVWLAIGGIGLLVLLRR